MPPISKAVARVHIGKFIPATTEANKTIKRGLTGARRNVDQLRKVLETLSENLKELESKDKLQNFELQELMSLFNQAETLASNILKKRDDTADSIVNKV